MDRSAPTKPLVSGGAASILENISDGFYLLDRELRFVLFNERCERYFDLRRTDVLGRRLDEVFPQVRDTVFESALQTAIESGLPQRIEGVSPTTGVPILLRAFPLEEGLAVVFTDVTSRNAADEENRKRDARYRMLFDSLEEGFCIIEMIFDADDRAVDYRFVEVNPAFARQSGLKDVLGRRIHELAPDHELHWCSLYGEVVKTGVPVRVEDRARALEGRWYEVSAFRLGDPAERQVGVLFNDVSDRRQAEAALLAANERLEARVLERTKELEDAARELESFNFSVSHDLRSPLRNVLGMASILREEVGPTLSPDHLHMLDRQIANAQRMSLLLDELLRLSRLSRAPLNRVPLDLTLMARQVAEVERDAYPDGAQVEVQEGMRADGDVVLVQALLQNLIGNALKFSPDGGTIRVRQEGDAFIVADEGVGFDMAHAAKIFDPFERLVRDSEFPGTGIGLANVERIVRRHGGRVSADASPGKGAVFSFTLAPCSPPDAAG